MIHESTGQIDGQRREKSDGTGR